jgi:hypothetical protein
MNDTQTIEAPVTPAPRYIFLNRMINGERKKFRFTVDAQMTIVEETPVEDAVTLTPANPDNHGASSPQLSPQMQWLKSRGYKFKVEPDGRLHILHTPELEIQIAKFFVPTTECPFPECEDLRQRYLADMEALKGEDGKCKSCDIGALQRKYRDVVSKNIEKHAPHLVAAPSV